MNGNQKQNTANGANTANTVNTATTVNGATTATRRSKYFHSESEHVEYSPDERSTPEYARKFGGTPRKANGCLDRCLNGPTGRVPQDQLFWFKAHGPARLRTYFQVSMLLMAIYIGVFAVRSFSFLNEFLMSS